MSIESLNFSSKADVVQRLNPNRLARVSSLDERVVRYPVGDKNFVDIMYEITSDAEKSAWNFNFAKPDVRKNAINEISQKLNIQI